MNNPLFILFLVILLIVSFSGCGLLTKSPACGNRFETDLTQSVTIGIAFDVNGKTVEQWAAAENQIDWDGKDQQPKLLCTAAFAAVELKTYLQKMCPKASVTLTDKSSEPTVDILIGTSDAISGMAGKIPVPEKPESYTISRVVSNDKQTLVVCGFDRAGMLYGTYELLDRLGVRWFGPQAWREVVPSQTHIMLTGLPIAGSPSFTSQRGFHDEVKKGTPEMFIWMARNKLNLWSYQEDHYPLQRKLCLLIAGGDHSWKDMLHPTAIKDPQGRTLFDNHPEWFAMIDGKRTSEDYQPCVSNRQALEYMLTRFIEQIQTTAYQYCDIINFWPYDSHKRWCECSNCTRLGNDTDKYIYAVAEVNKGLKQAYAQSQIPRVPRLGLCAYDGTETREAPCRPIPADFDYALNYFTFFPIRRCYAHTLDDPACTELNTNYARQFEDWYKSSYKGELVAGEYYNVSRYESLPLLFYHTAPHDMRYYYRHNARGFNYMHATSGEWGTRTLTNWMMAKLCWDIEANPNELLDIFLTEYFGPVAKQMRSAFEDISEAYANVAAWRSWADASIYMQLIKAVYDPNVTNPFTLDHLQWDRRAKGKNSAISVIEGRQKLDAASEKVAAAMTKPMPADIRTRTEELQWHLHYGDLSYRFYMHMSKTVILDRSGQTSSAMAEFEKAKKIAEELKKNKFTYLDVTGKANWFDKTQIEGLFNYFEKKYTAAHPSE